MAAAAMMITARESSGASPSTIQKGMFSFGTSSPATGASPVIVGPPRLRLVGRSISDFSPLCDPTAPSHIDSQSSTASTHAHVAGVKVVSGGKLATGGQAPMSPFLPLPPAPSMDELRTLGSSQGKNGLLASHAMSPTSSLDGDEVATPRMGYVSRYASSTDDHTKREFTFEDDEPTNGRSSSRDSNGTIKGSPSKRQRRAETLLAGMDGGSSSPALNIHWPASRHHRGSEFSPRTQPKSVCMIRSYSVPVSTQSEFDEQTRLMSWGSTARYSNAPLWASGWPSSVTSSSESSASESNLAVPEAMSTHRRASQIAPCDRRVSQQDSSPQAVPKPRSSSPLGMSRQGSNAAVPLTVRSPLATLTSAIPQEKAPVAVDSVRRTPLLAHHEDENSIFGNGLVSGLSAEKKKAESDAFSDDDQDYLTFSMPGLSPPRRAGLPSSLDRGVDGMDDLDGNSSGYVSDDTSNGARTPRAGSPVPMATKEATISIARLSISDDQTNRLSDEQQALPWAWSGFIHPDHM